jgi:hypothetical protein
MPGGNPHAFRIGFFSIKIVPVNALLLHDVISLEETLLDRRLTGPTTNNIKSKAQRLKLV